MTINPCGQVMGYLRSCYSRQARFVKGDPRTETIRWYWAPEGARLFPGPHRFGPISQQEPNVPTQDLGEVELPNPTYSKGETSPIVDGLRQCGDMTDFYEGTTSYLTTPQHVDSFGVPDCCIAPCPFITCYWGHIVSGSGLSWTLQADPHGTPTNRYWIDFSINDNGPEDAGNWCGPEAIVVACSCPIPDGFNPGGDKRYDYIDSAFVDHNPTGSCAGLFGHCGRRYSLLYTSPFTVTLTFAVC